jgi:hypothetical protein
MTLVFARCKRCTFYGSIDKASGTCFRCIESDGSVSESAPKKPATAVPEKTATAVPAEEIEPPREHTSDLCAKCQVRGSSPSYICNDCLDRFAAWLKKICPEPVNDAHAQLRARMP